MPLDHARNRRSLERASLRAAEFLKAVPELEARVPNSEWTIGEAAAHIVAGLRTYGSWATGSGTPEQLGLIQSSPPAEIAKMNDARIATVDRTDAASLASALLDATESYLSGSEELAGDSPFEWYDHILIDVASITSIMLAEVLVHFYDIAKAAGQPWPIDPKDAEQMVLGALALLPHYVNKETAAGVNASWDIRIRGGASIGIRLDDTVATLQDPPSGRYDCIVNADPIALLLVSYGRIGLTGPILKGKLLAFGRKPWLGLKFNGYFLKP